MVALTGDKDVRYNAVWRVTIGKCPAFPIMLHLEFHCGTNQSFQQYFLPCGRLSWDTPAAAVPNDDTWCVT